MMSAYMTVWKARFLDVDKKSSVTVLMSPLAARSRPWDQQLWKPCRLPTVEDLTNGTGRRPHRSASRARGPAPSRPYRKASLCDVAYRWCFSACLALALSRSPVSVSSQCRRSRIASTLSLVLATLLSVRWPAEESDLLTEWIRCTCTYCASARQAKAL